MAQSKVMLAFRARMKSRGYYDVSIKKCRDCLDEIVCNDFGDELWLVNFKEPLFGWTGYFACSEKQASNWPGIKFDVGFFEKPEQLCLFDEDGNLVLDDNIGDGKF